MIIGHERLIKDLKNLADRGGLSHGYLFWGPERVGKKTAALAFANYLEEKVFETPSGILSDNFLIVPREERSIGIDRIREIKNFLWQKPNRSSHRTVVIDDAQLLTNEAQDALLKISENPPASGLVILVVRNPELLKQTLSSRFQKIYFSSVPREEIKSWLVREHKLSPSRAEELANDSLNQPGRAIALFGNKTHNATEESAKKFLRLSRSEKSVFVKDLVARDTFRLEDFLDALIVQILRTKNFDLWHRVLALRRDASYLNVNPRLQLETLLGSRE